MSATLLDGKALAQSVRGEVGEEVAALGRPAPSEDGWASAALAECVEEGELDP